MEYPNKLIKLGDIDKNISLVKRRLNELGFGPLVEEILNFGPSTERAVKNFQEANQLIPDGIIGELTWNALFFKRKEENVNSLIIGERALQIAKTQLFVREKTGRNDGIEVESYLKAVGLGKGYAWCQAFVYWCFQLASEGLGIKNPVTKTAGVLEHKRQTKGRIIFDYPQRGDIFIMNFGKGKGHTGIVDSVRSKSVTTVEGNTNMEGSREGNGVFERLRQMNTIDSYIRY